MLATLGKILGSILRSIFISAVMLLITLSVITGKFPPDFDRLQKTYLSLQAMTKLSREIHDQKKKMDHEQAIAGSVEEEDLRKLEELNIRRAELGANLLPSGGEVPASGSLSSGGGDNKGLSSEQLESKVRALQQDLFRLQERVYRLEARAKGERP